MPRIIETETRYEEHRDCRTAEQMTALCCEDAPALPCCEEIEPEWNGYSEDDVLKSLGITLDAAGRDGSGRLVEIQFELREKPCGEMVTKYDLSGGNCCDEIEPIVWDHEATPEVLPAGESIMVYMQGGLPPYRFRVTNHALSWPDGRREWISAAPYAMLTAAETFCGGAVVYVDDSCGQVIGHVRSDLGSWQYIGNDCMLAGQQFDSTDGDTWIRQYGLYRQVEDVVYDRTIVNLSTAGWGECEKLPIICAMDLGVGNTCLALNPNILDTDCVAQPILGTKVCSANVRAVARASVYAQYGYDRWSTLTLALYKWSC